MGEKQKTKEQLTKELVKLKQRIGELERLEARDRPAVRRYRALFEQSLDAVYVHDFKGRFIDANPAALKLTGYKKKEITSVKFASLLSLDQIPTARKALKELKKTGSQKKATEFKLKRKNGDYIFVETKASVIHEEGKPCRILGIARDITERKEAEEELRQSEYRFKTIFSNVIDGILLADLKEKKFYTGNKMICKMLGYNLEELKELGVNDIHPEKDLPYVIDQFKKQSKGKITLARDIPVKRKNGSVFFADINSSQISLGRKTYLMGIFRDITERRLTEEALRQRTYELSERVKELRCLYEIDEICVRRESTLEEILKGTVRIIPPGYQYPKITGSCITFEDKKFKTRNFRETKWMQKENIITDGQKAGSVNVCYSEKKPELDEGPFFKEERNLINAIAKRLGQTIERYQAVATLRRNRNHLDMLVKERTAELQQTIEKLEEARRDVEAATRAKSEFLANMSHELRTPLNSIIGFSEIMADGLTGPLTDEQKEYLNDILESGRHLLELINDVLDLSKIEAGKTELEVNKFSLKGLLDRSLAVFRNQAADRNITILSDIPEIIGEVTADDRRTKQIIFNLLSNALKFTPDGGKVGITAHRMDKKIQITVWDTGVGIAKKDLKNLFKPFQQLETGLTEKVPGTGLGLNLSKKLVELQGGKIWVESKRGQGSKFSFTIPIEVKG